MRDPTTDKPVLRDHRGRLQPGTKGVNPGGRPRGAAGLAAIIQRETQGGEELVQYVLRVFRSRSSDEPTIKHFYSEADIQWAIGWLTDRGFGKAVQTLELATGTTDHEVNAIAATLVMMSDAELETYERELEIAERAFASADRLLPAPPAPAIDADATELE
jgi:hypothetical protein